MEIKIDTQKDSPEDIKRLIDFLKQFTAQAPELANFAGTKEGKKLPWEKAEQKKALDEMDNDVKIVPY